VRTLVEVILVVSAALALFYVLLQW